MNQVVIKVIGNYSYQTSRCLGEGVYGKVYEGMQRETKQKVAIKKIDLATFTNDKYLENAIFSQIYLLKRFNHPNIVKFKDVLSSKNSLYIITQFCKNGDLKQLIKRKRFKQDQVFQVMKQIMNGFAQLIREKIIHRDLKPANILINQGVYKIGDFGFAKYVDNFGSQMLKSCVGSPIYMAPQILERTQYSTKCDIWSMGIIFYQMIFGYPPWKARDQYELLRGIKTIPISHIIRRQSLSSKASDFLKRTLAYSQQQRIGWADLFELFGPKVEVVKQQIVEVKNYQKDRKYQGTTTNTTTNWNQSKNTAITTTSTSTKTQNNISGLQINSGQRRRNSTNSYPNNQQLQNCLLWRQFCIYYNFFCVELFLKYSTIKNTIGNIQIYGKLLFSIATNVKYRSTYALSMLSMTYKQNKSLQDLHKNMKTQHQSYQMVYNQIISLLDKQNLQKKVKQQFYLILGRSDIINQDKIQKTQSQIIKYAHENAQILSDQVLKRGKNVKEIIFVEILDFVLDVLSLGVGKGKALKELKDSVKSQEQDLKDYLSKVISKLDRLTANF